MIRTQMDLENKILNGLAKVWVLDKAGTKQLCDRGVDWKQWPECQAKMVVREFETTMRIKSEDFARFMVWPLAEKLPAEELPEDIDMLMANYSEGIRAVKAINLGQELLRNPDRAADLVAEFQKSAGNNAKMKTLHESLKSIFEEQVRLSEAGQSIVRLMGWEGLSNAISGFNPGRLSIITAESGIGKTTLARNFSIAASKSGFEKVLFFNMEMSEQDFAQGFVQIEAEMDFRDWLNSPKSKTDDVDRAIERMKGRSSIRYTEGKSLTLDSILSTIYSEHEGGMMFVVVDYDQKIQIDSREEEWKYIVRAIERLEEAAKATCSHVIVLAQGDGDGDPKASKRSKQPAAAVLQLSGSDDEGYYITTIKNRFGKRLAKIPVNFIPEKGIIQESSVPVIRGPPEDTLSKYRKTKKRDPYAD